MPRIRTARRPRHWNIGWPSRRGVKSRSTRRPRQRRSLALQQLESRIAFSVNPLAVTPTLVTDLNRTPLASFPQLGSAFGPTASGLVFLADDAIHGNEPWITDGTAAGTRLLEDLTPGTEGSSIGQTSPLFNGSYYFVPFLNSSPDGISENPPLPELWKTDGTAGGTVRVATLTADSSFVSQYAPLGNKLYFVSGASVWETDGTEAGTKSLGAIGDGEFSVAVELFALGGQGYAIASQFGVGLSLYRLSSTGQPELVTTVPGVSRPFTGPYAAASVTLGSRFVFTAAADSSSPAALWATDGTAAGTGPVFSGGEGPTAAEGFKTFGGSAYFSGTTAAAGAELWKTDGTAAGTQLVKDIATGSDDSSPRDLTIAAGRLFFSATTAAAGTELWATDGTTGGTNQVADIATGSVDGQPNSSFPVRLTPFNNKLYFVANDFSLWESNGTAGGTTVVKSVTPDPTLGGSGGFGALAEFNGRLFFDAYDATQGLELWSSDGTTQGTGPLKDIAVGNADGLTDGSASYLAGAALGGLFLFAGDDGTTGTELYRRDSAGNVVLLKDIAPEQSESSWSYNPGSDPADFTTVGGTVYFSAGDGSYGGVRQAWRSNGTIAGTARLGTVTSQGGEFEFTAFGGFTFFVADGPTGGRALYRTQGTDASTVLWADNFDGYSLTVCNGSLYAIVSGEIRVLATPTSAPVRAAFDDGSVFASPWSLSAVGNKLFVAATAGDSDGLFVTDGSLAGTKPVRTGGGAAVSPSMLTPATGTLYFVGSTPTTGRELWRTQVIAGVETAVLVKDLAAGAADSFLYGIVADGSRAYFLRYANESQDPGTTVLWETDGTAARTREVAFAGSQAAVIQSLSRPVGRTIYAAASDATRGRELWSLQLPALPGVATNLQAVPGPGRVSLSWTAGLVAGAPAIEDFVIQFRRASETSWSTFADAVSPGTTAQVTGLVAGANYVFRVIARNEAGDGSPSAVVTGTIPTPPSAPRSLTASGGLASVSLAWTAPATVGSGPVSDYLIQYRRGSETTWSTFSDAVSTATTATVTGLAGSTNYVFRVLARSSAGDSLPSATAVATTLAVPTAPRSLAATGGAASAALTWLPPVSNGAAAITDYVIQYRRGSETTWSTFSDAVSTATTATVTGLAGSANYVFRVLARSAAGDSLPSATAAATTLAAPSQPRQLAVVAQAGSAALSWLAPANAGSRPITDYIVQFRRLSVPTWSTWNDGVSTNRTATVSGLISGANYVFQVLARSEAGDSPPSNQRTVTIG